MGSGGTTALRPPGKFCLLTRLPPVNLICIRLKIFSHPPKHLRRCKVKPHGSLVPVSSTHRCAYTPGLSTSYTRHRAGNSIRMFRLGKMRHQGHFANIRHRPQLLPDGKHAIGLEAQPIHPTVHFKINIQRGF